MRLWFLSDSFPYALRQFPTGKMATMSGVTVTDDVVSEFQTIKLGKKYSYIQMKISDDKKVIEMEKSVETCGYEDFVKQFPANDCRYAIFDFDYELGDSGQRNELVFFVWCVCDNTLFTDLSISGLR